MEKYIPLVSSYDPTSLSLGTDTKGALRSLPLPKLDAVTREAAKNYFDNSWTLYETLFAGLNGEEYFYRYVEYLDIQ